MIEIRRMTLDDLPAVVEIEHISFSMPWSERAFRYEVQENPAARGWVTTLDGRVVAMMVLWMIADEAHIATIATHPHFRRRGFARQMLIKALQAARQEGAKHALLEVRAHHHAAQNLYRSLGFIEVGYRPKYYFDNGEDAILMNLETLDALEGLEAE